MFGVRSSGLRLRFAFLVLRTTAGSTAKIDGAGAASERVMSKCPIAAVAR